MTDDDEAQFMSPAIFQFNSRLRDKNVQKKLFETYF